jgi:hypothetical protein
MNNTPINYAFLSGNLEYKLKYLPMKVTETLKGHLVDDREVLDLLNDLVRTAIADAKKAERTYSVG